MRGFAATAVPAYPAPMARTPFETLKSFALGFPEAWEDHPWGETVVKVRARIFLFLHEGEKELRLSVKLPRSREFALEYPFTRPTGYGLGRSGWVTASFAGRARPPLDVLQAWIEESYRAVAPKKLAARLPRGGAAPGPAG
ncbi:MAG TPA: MmcQ/YjbR family DNA-binding protein [Dongiaceae bacterium]|nr:MmcQ/YjbR family DNA-binding protein [Dongiaceae bacterium]